MVRLCENVQFQVKPLSKGKSSSQTKKKFNKNSFNGCLNGAQKVCAKFEGCSTISC